MKVLQIRNREKAFSIDLRLARGIIGFFLKDLLKLSSYEIAVHFVPVSEIVSLNETFLHHAGSTDVITFEYSSESPGLQGEIFVCVSEAVQQASRFHQAWQSELLRYVVHGVLHLQGYKDDQPVQKRIMRREENKWIALLSARYDLARLAGFKGTPAN